MIVKTIIIDEENHRMIIKNDKIKRISNIEFLNKEEKISKVIDEVIEECFM